jgi:hypothetical protein
MFTIAEIMEFPKIGFIATCYSEHWNNLNRNEVRQELADTKAIKINNHVYSVKDFDVNIPFVGGNVIDFNLGEEFEVSGITFPATGELIGAFRELI